MNNSFENVEILQKEFEGASDRAAAIVAGAFLDEILSEVLQAFFVGDKTSDKKIFEGTGFLSTFSSKIEMAFRLGLISKREHQILHTVRSIRNEFAHELRDVSFNSQSITARCKNIETPVEMVAPILVPLSQKGEPPPPPRVSKAQGDNPRALFQETVATLMHMLAARFCQASATRRSSPKDFSLAHESGKIILDQLKKNFEKIQQLRSEYSALAKDNGIPQASDDGDPESDKKMLLLIKIQEYCVEQIKAAHAEQTKKI